MKKFKLTRANISVLALILVLGGLAGFSVYQFIQFKNLKSRVASVENRSKDLETNAYGGELFDGAKGPGSIGSFELLSEERKKLRVDTGVYDKQYDEVTYEEKEINVFQIKVTNNEDYVLQVDRSMISAELEGGEIVSSATIHPDDEKGEPYISLAPKGSTEIYVYIADKGKKIVGFYDTNNSTKIDLKR